MSDDSQANVLSAILDRLSRIEERGKKQSRKINQEIRALKDSKLSKAEKAEKKAAKERDPDKRPSESQAPKTQEAQATSAQRDDFGEVLARLPAEARAKLEKAIAEVPAVKEAFAAIRPHVASPNPQSSAAQSAETAQTTLATGGRGPGPARVLSIMRPRSQTEFAKLERADRDALMADPAFHPDELPRVIRE